MAKKDNKKKDGPKNAESTPVGKKQPQLKPPVDKPKKKDAPKKADNTQKIETLKAKLQKGGLSKAEQQKIAENIKSLGGKVNLANFPAPGQTGNISKTKGDGKKVSGGLTQPTTTVNPATFPVPQAAAPQPTAPAPDPRGDDETTDEDGGEGDKDYGRPGLEQGRVGELGQQPPPTDYNALANPTESNVGTVNPNAGTKGLNEVQGPGGLVRRDNSAEEQENLRDIQLNNPNTVNPFGGVTTEVDEHGNVIRTESLSQDQQKILDQDEALSQTGRDLALQQLGSSGFGQAFNPQTAQRTSTGDLLADRQRMEEEAYNRATRTFGRDKAREMEDYERTMFNRGISLDPRNDQYAKGMQDLNERWDARYDDARGRAIEMGGNEMTRSFQQNEQLIANQMSQQQGIRNQQLGEVGALQGMGTGLQVPNFQPYQGTNVNFTDPSAAYFQWQQMQQNQQSLDQAAHAQGQAYDLAVRNSAKANQPPPAPDPFNPGPPPGA